MFYNLLVWLFSKPKGRTSKPGPVLETTYIFLVFLILVAVNNCSA